MSDIRKTRKTRKFPSNTPTLEEFIEETNLVESFFRVKEPISTNKQVFKLSLCHKCRGITLKDIYTNSFQHFPDKKVCNCIKK